MVRVYLYRKHTIFALHLNVWLLKGSKKAGALCCRSGRNIPNLVFNKSSALNTYDILRADKIVVDKASLEFINEFFGPSEATA